jgi:hypothetical protein
VVQAGTTSHQKTVERGVCRQWHQELKLISYRSILVGDQHCLGHLLLKVLLMMNHLESKQVTIKSDRCVQIGNRDTDMIKIEKARKPGSEIGGPSGHGH